MYSILSYGYMIGDEGRMTPYVESMRRAIRPGSVVVDIGTGTGIFALLACRFGAKRVYAIDPSDSITIAQEIANVNGYHDRIYFVQKHSTETVLPEKADIIISELRGKLPFFGSHLESIIDARKRFLKSGGIMIPHKDKLWAGIIENSEFYGTHCDPWDKYDLDMKPAKKIITNSASWPVGDVDSDMLLTDEKCWFTIDYNTVTETDGSDEIKFSVLKSGIGHGVLVWFNTDLFEGLGFSNSPRSSKPARVYGRSFLPWPEPVRMDIGDSVSVRIEARLTGSDYIYRWDTYINGKEYYRQSTFFSEVLSTEKLRMRNPAYIPKINHEGKVDHFIVSRIANGMSVGEIAREVSKEWPSQFSDWQAAMGRVGDLVRKYSE